MRFNKKKHFMRFVVLGIITIIISFISYKYGKNVVIKDLSKSGDVYINKKEYDKAIAVYEEVVRYDRNDNDKNMLNLAITMENSKKAYYHGIRYYKKGDYLSAIKLFRQVMENDGVNFNKAQKKIKECTDKYIEDNLKNAEKSVEASKYKEADKYLNNILSLDKDNEKAHKLKYKIHINM
ncbi:tetratricopeptide repeat protein [Clostridium botulinum]|nr:tetratricopeptide repeat protein [Clostridium botulinum]